MSEPCSPPTNHNYLCFVPPFGPETRFSSHFKSSLTKSLTFLNSAFIVGKRETLLMAFLKSSYLNKFFVDKKTTIPTTFSQASFPFHSGTESGRELKAIRTVCSRTLLLSFFLLDFEWLFLLIWNQISITFSLLLQLFFLFKALKSSYVCVCVCVWEREREREREHALQCPFAGGVFYHV